MVRPHLLPEGQTTIASYDAQAALGIVERSRTLVREYFQAYDDVHRWMSEELPFCADLDQYDDDQGNEKNLDRIQPRDQAVFHHWVYKRGVALKRAPIHIVCEPVDDTLDPPAAEDMKRALEWELILNRRAGFKRVRREYVGGALMARAWSAAVDYDPERDMLKYRSVDPRNVAFTPGFLSPHDPDCPVFIEKVRMHIEQARRMPGWKNAKKLMPDEGEPRTGHGSTSGDAPGTVNFRDGAGVDVDVQETPSFVTIAKIWYRFNPDGALEVERTLAPGERTMVCVAGCGYESAPEGPEGEYPEVAPQSCPTCQADLVRSESRTESTRNRLVIMPIAQPWGDEPLYDGDWPVPDCPTFPYLWLVAYDMPHKAVGPSDVSQNWTVALTKNATVRLIWEQAVRAKTVPLIPNLGIEDHNGERYEFLPAQDVAFYNADMPPQGASMLHGGRVTGELFQLMEILQGSYHRYEGTSDIAIAPGETKDIPVGTLEQLTETGNVPIDDFVEIMYEAESVFFTVIAYYIRATYGEEKLIRYYNEAGQLMFKRMRAGGMPGVDVAVSAGPTLDNVKQERVQAFQMLISMPPQYREAFARFARIDPSVLQEISKADKQFMQGDPQMQMMMQQAKQARIQQMMGGGGNGAQGSPAASGAAGAGRTTQGVM